MKSYVPVQTFFLASNILNDVSATAKWGRYSGWEPVLEEFGEGEMGAETHVNK